MDFSEGLIAWREKLLAATLETEAAFRACREHDPAGDPLSGGPRDWFAIDYAPSVSFLPLHQRLMEAVARETGILTITMGISKLICGGKP